MRIRRLKRTHYYTVDNEVYEMKLGPYPLLVYNALSYHANPYQQVFSSQSLLAEELGISTRQCHRALQVLKARGLIAIEQVSGKINRYTLLPIKKKNRQPLTDRQRGMTVSHRGVTVSQGGMTDSQGSSQEVGCSPISAAALRAMSVFAKTSKQNNITKLDEQNSPRNADKSSFEQDPQGNTTPSGVAEQNPLSGEITDLIEDIQKWSRQYCRANKMHVPDELTALWAGYAIKRLGVAKVREIFEEHANAYSPCLDSFWKALKG